MKKKKNSFRNKLLKISFLYLTVSRKSPVIQLLLLLFAYRHDIKGDRHKIY